MAYFSRQGFPCPRHTNPAEHIIDLVSTDFDSAKAAAADAVRIERLTGAWARLAASGSVSSSGGPAHPAVPATSAPPRRRSPLVRFGLLVRRSWRQNARDGWLNGVRLIVSGGLALVFGEIFGQLTAPTAASVSERVAILSYAARAWRLRARCHPRGGPHPTARPPRGRYASINMAMMSVMKSLDLLGREKPVVARERTRGLYGSAECVPPETSGSPATALLQPSQVVQFAAL